MLQFLGNLLRCQIWHTGQRFLFKYFCHCTIFKTIVISIHHKQPQSTEGIYTFHLDKINTKIFRSRIIMDLIQQPVALSPTLFYQKEKILQIKANQLVKINILLKTGNKPNHLLHYQKRSLALF